MKSIKKLFTHTVLGAFVFAALMFAGIAFPAKVQAATQYENHDFYMNQSKTQHAKIGGVHIWYYKDLKYSKTSAGVKTTIYTPRSNEQILPSVVSNSSYVWYAVQKKGASTATVYAFNLKTNARKALCTYRTAYGNFKHYYNGKIYLSRSNGDTAGEGDKITRYDSKTRKYRQIKKAVSSYSQQYGRYILFANPSGDPTPVKLYVYDTLTDNNKTISYKSNMYKISNGTIYYLDWTHSSKKAFLYRCKLDGSYKKIIATIPALSPAAISGALGDTYAIVAPYDAYGHQTYVKIDYRTGKTSLSNESELRKLWGY